MTSDEGTREAPTVASLAELYLGNILYSLEMTAMTLEGQEKLEDAAFYRGIARELANAHGRSAERSASRPGSHPAGG